MQRTIIIGKLSEKYKSREDNLIFKKVSIDYL